MNLGVVNAGNMCRTKSDHISFRTMPWRSGLTGCSTGRLPASLAAAC